MKYLPLFVNLKNRPVLIVGGGKIAYHKIYLLEKTGAIINVVANELCLELKEKLFLNRIKWIGKVFQPIMLKNIFLVVVATNDCDLNSIVFYHADKHSVLVNTVDNQSKCSFIFPSIISRDPIILGISSCGQAPVLVRILREKLESLLPQSIGSIARIAGMWRNQVKKHIKDLRCRRYFWEKLFYNNCFSLLIEQKKFKKAHQIIKNFIYSYKYDNDAKKGSVALVGAGPGDVGLLTIRGLQVMQQADVVLYDYLINPDILDLARRDSSKICVGKCFGKHLISQEKLNNLIIRLAQSGNHVVRLKGGDSFIFGRGGEELQAVSKAGISFQIVPGITAGIGAAAYAGIPLTHRDYSHSVTFITGHKSYDNSINWKTLSSNDQTLVIYMGANNIMNISKNLIFNGRHTNTPVAIISRGTYQNQKVVISTLIELENLVYNMHRPILLIIGNVVLLYKHIQWFGNYP